MTVEELERGYVWIYQEFYSWANILRRVPDGPWEQKIRFLVFNIALKKANWLWAVLIRLNVLHFLFHVYWRLLGAGMHPGLPRHSRQRRVLKSRQEIG